MAKDLIIACDFSSKQDTVNFLSQFKDKKPFVKIGMELYYSCGPDIVREIKDRGHKIFLDLKCHDIPNTVKKTMKVLSQMQVDMTNLHAAGSKAMMEAAREGLGNEAILIAVTQLTSISQETLENELLIKAKIEDVVASYAELARDSGLNGVVCSPLEAGIVKKACSSDFLCVTPGIRYADANTADQKRVTTPKQAQEIGSDYIVVGRPITQAKNPLEAYEKMLNEFLR